MAGEKENEKEITHINELLCYATNYIHNSTLLNIKKIIEMFYSGEEVSTAKSLLWDLRGGNLAPIIDRKTTIKRTGTAANIDDIFDALLKLDAEQDLPIFVARDVERIPDRQPEQLNILTVIDRLSKIEHSLKVQDEAVTNFGFEMFTIKDVLEQHSKKIENFEDKTNPANNHQVKKTDSNKNAGYSTSDSSNTNKENKDNIKDIQADYDKDVINNNKISSHSNHESADDTKNVLMKIKRFEDEMLLRTPDIKQIDPANDDDEGFQLYESRSARRRRLQNESPFEGAPLPQKIVFVNRIAKGNSKTIVNHLNKNNIKSQEIEMVSHPDAKFKSFKVKIFTNDLNKVLGRDFWPSGVNARMWKQNKSVFFNNNNNTSFAKKSFVTKNLPRRHSESSKLY